MKYFKHSVKEYFVMNTGYLIDIWEHNQKIVKKFYKKALLSNFKLKQKN